MDAEANIKHKKKQEEKHKKRIVNLSKKEKKVRTAVKMLNQIHSVLAKFIRKTYELFVHRRLKS